MKKNKGKTADTDDVKKDDEEQSQRFVDTAKAVDVYKDGKAFKKAIDSIKGSKQS